jgi:hypothetical protein
MSTGNWRITINQSSIGGSFNPVIVCTPQNGFSAFVYVTAYATTGNTFDVITRSFNTGAPIDVPTGINFIVYNR